MNDDKLIKITMTVGQARVIQEDLKNGIAANQHLIDDIDGNTETWEQARQKMKIFISVRKIIIGALKVFTL